MKTFKLPDLGEGLTEAEIVTWHVSPGDHVVAEQPLVSVETAKAVVEIPAPWSGNVTRLLVNVGDILETGDDMLELDTEARVDQGAIVGDIPQSKTEAGSNDSVKIKASPAVRKRASELHIDLATISGSGPQGAITQKDLEQAGTVQETPPQPVDLVRGVRRTMARVMTKAAAEVVAASVTEEADIHRWADSENVMVRLVRALQSGIAAEPGLNAWYSAETGQRQLLKQCNVGIAVDSNDGLFVPVLRDVEKLSDTETVKALEKMRSGVVNRTTLPEEMRNPSITLSNFGMIGGIHAALVIVPPQVAILGVGRRMMRPVAVEKNTVIHPILPLSLTFDHRVVTGGEAARFLSAIVAALETEEL